ncbi:MAG TPA: hypothetical protein PKC30_07590 [Saprospiraceae bacterium]|nr:hypothetical protein [Saprospiraceae bacterium]
MIVKKYIGWPVMIFIFSMLLISCSKNKVDCDDPMSVNDLLSSEVQSLNQAITAFNADPTSSSLCRDLRNAFDSYIDVLRDIRECFDPAQQAQLDQDISEATQNRNSLTC